MPGLRGWSMTLSNLHFIYSPSLLPSLFPSLLPSLLPPLALSPSFSILSTLSLIGDTAMTVTRSAGPTKVLASVVPYLDTAFLSEHQIPGVYSSHRPRAGSPSLPETPILKFHFPLFFPILLSSTPRFLFIMLCVSMYVCWHTHATEYLWRPDKNLLESFLSSYQVGPEDWIQVVKLGGRCLYPRSHLAFPFLWILKDGVQCRLASNFEETSCLCLQGAGIVHIQQNAQLGSLLFLLASVLSWRALSANITFRSFSNLNKKG